MTESDRNGEGGRILVVDDQEANRLLLRDLLESQGLRVDEAVDGPAALAQVAANDPDVVLLDVNMPGMDGFEVCRRLKAAPETAKIPVLLVTALAHREDRLRGIEAGANDYVTKPFDTAELVARVRNALALRRLHARTESQYRRLRDLEHLRDGLVHMLVHDLRTPLTGIRLYLEMLRQDAPATSDESDFAELLDEANAITTRMAEMVNDMLDTNRLEEGKMPLEHVACDMRKLVSEAIEMVASRGRQSPIAVTSPASVPALCDPTVIRRVITNLIGNAVDFSPEQAGVSVTVENGGGVVKVRVTDQGPGIPPEYHERIFEKFGQLEALRNRVKHSTGLGLTFCRLAIDAHGGKIGVESEPGHGSTFWFQIPAPTS